MKNNNTLNYFDIVLFTLLLASLTILPLLKINDHLYIGIEEFLIPLLFIRVITTKSFFFNKYILLMAIFVVYIFITILINNRATSLRDYFELYKIGKFVIVIFFTSYFIKLNIKNFIILIYSIFIILLFFNILHYIDFLNFNTIIEPYYAINKIQLDFFGLDTLGNPSVKRMLGTMGNPNNNAILFLFFFAFFLSRKKQNLFATENIFLYLSFLCILLTQSRTGFLATLTVYIIWAIVSKPLLKNISIDLIVFASCFFVAILFDALALFYFSNTVETMDDMGGLYQNRSVMGRIEVWQHLIGMIKHKVLFGHGPNKDYFYENGLYAESEYVLYLWRYGIFGIILYLGWILGLFYNSLKFAKKDLFFLMVVVIVLVNAVSNCPLTNPRILILFGITAGYWISFVEKQNTSI